MKETSVETSLEKVGSSEIVKVWMESKTADLTARLPSSYNVKRFKEQVISIIEKNKNLLLCTGQSVVSSVIQAAELGLDLSPTLGEAYLIPYKVKGVMTASFMPGYRGLIKLAVKSGMVKLIEARIVYKGDFFEYAYGTNPFINHKPNLAASHGVDDIVCAYATATMSTGEKMIEVLTLGDIAVIREHAASQDIWNSDPGEMTRKSAVRRIIKYIPASAGSPIIELERAMAADNAVFEMIDEKEAVYPEKSESEKKEEGSKNLSPKEIELKKIYDLLLKMFPTMETDETQTKAANDLLIKAFGKKCELPAESVQSLRKGFAALEKLVPKPIDPTINDLCDEIKKLNSKLPADNEKRVAAESYIGKVLDRSMVGDVPKLTTLRDKLQTYAEEFIKTSNAEAADIFK